MSFHLLYRNLDERKKWMKVMSFSCDKLFTFILDMLCPQELHKAMSDDSERRNSFASFEKYSTLLHDPETHSTLDTLLFM